MVIVVEGGWSQCKVSLEACSAKSWSHSYLQCTLALQTQIHGVGWHASLCSVMMAHDHRAGPYAGVVWVAKLQRNHPLLSSGYGPAESHLEPIMNHFNSLIAH